MFNGVAQIDADPKHQIFGFDRSTRLYLQHAVPEGEGQLLQQFILEGEGQLHAAPDGVEEPHHRELGLAAGDEGAASSEEDSSDLEEEDESSWSRNCPGLGTWLNDRCGTPLLVLLVLSFVLVTGVQTIAREEVWLNCMYEEKTSWLAQYTSGELLEMYDTGHPNVMATLVVMNAISLAVSLSLTLALEGTWALDKVFDIAALWRFCIIAAMFQLAQHFSADAYALGIPPLWVTFLGFTYLPVSILMKYLLMEKQYGSLELLACAICLFSASAYIFLRENDRSENRAVDWIPQDKRTAIIGFAAILLGVVVSAMASVLAERIFKDKSSGLRRIRGLRHDHYYIHKVHLDSCSLFLALLVWTCPLKLKRMVFGIPADPYWFGSKGIEGWSPLVWVYIFSSVAVMFACGLMAKKFDTAVKGLIQTIAIMLATFLADVQSIEPLHRVGEWRLPAILLTIITVFAILVFQTGRVHMDALQRSLGISRANAVELSVSNVWHQFKSMKSNLTGTKKSLDDVNDVQSGYLETFRKYSIIILYTLVYPFNTEIYVLAVSRSVCTPQVFVLAVNLVMLIYSVVQVAFRAPPGRNGMDDLREAMMPSMLLKFSGCGFMAAFVSLATSFAIGLGMKGAMKEVLGRFYVPVGAFLSTWIVRRFYLWLEWFAIIIVFLALATFSILKDSQASDDGSKGIPILAYEMQILAASVAALTSLVMERLMTDDIKAGKTFMMQKLRTDFGCLVWSIIFLWPAGWAATAGSFSSRAGFWRQRPSTFECFGAGVCGSMANATFVPNQIAVGSYFYDMGGYEGDTFAWWACANCSDFVLTPPPFAPELCSCTNSLLVGFDVGMIYVGLLSVAVYSLLVGLVVTNFGFNLRTVADNIGLLLVIYIGDPIVNGIITGVYDFQSQFKIQFVPNNFVAFIVPFGSQLQQMAADELHQFEALREEQLEEDGNGDCETSQEQESEDSDGH